MKPKNSTTAKAPEKHPTQKKKKKKKNPQKNQTKPTQKRIFCFHELARFHFSNVSSIVKLKISISTIP
jgi:hypothetical protein